MYGVKNYNQLGSTLGRQIAGYGGKLKWSKWEEISATLFYGLIKNHAFHDANKRTALLTLLYQLLKFGRTPDCNQKDLDMLALRVASDKLNLYYDYKKYKKNDDPEIQFLAYFLRRNSREIDKRYYPVTYQEFNRLLNKHEVYLENPYRNHIDVIQYKEERGFLGAKRKKSVKILQIGFPSWKTQIGSKAQREVLKAAKLTAEYGFDSQVFFKGAEPLDALIDQYSDPLKRLKDK